MLRGSRCGCSLFLFSFLLEVFGKFIYSSDVTQQPRLNNTQISPTTSHARLIWKSAWRIRRLQPARQQRSTGCGVRLLSLLAATMAMSRGGASNLQLKVTNCLVESARFSYFTAQNALEAERVFLLFVWNTHFVTKGKSKNNGTWGKKELHPLILPW